MPDGDSLNWKVRGTGSRRVLALVRSGADVQLVGERAIWMFATQASEGGWKPAILEMTDAIEHALQQLPANPTFTESARLFDSLDRRLNRIASDYPDGGIAIMKQAAESAFAVLEETGAPFTRTAIEQEMLVQAVRAVLDHRVLQPTRDEIARECNRDGSEQCCYEREVLHAAGQFASRLQGTVFAGADPIKVRTPPRSVPRKATTVERLRDTLTVLPRSES